MNAELDSFERQLLSELRQYVADGAAPGGESERRRRHIVRTRLALLTAGAAAVIVAVLVIPGIGSSPAYSVGFGNAGEIYVEINRPEDAKGLERALEDHGIAADITYLPELQMCAPGRYTAVDRKLTGMMTSVGEHQISVTIPPNAVRDGESFVLAWSVLPMTAEEMAEVATEPGVRVSEGFHVSVEFDVAIGAVAPCEPIAGT